MKINIENSPILRRIADEAETRGALAVVRQVILGCGANLTADDDARLASLGLPELREVMLRSMKGDPWSENRLALPGVPNQPPADA